VITFLGLSPALDVTYLVPRLTPGQIHRPDAVLALAGGKALNATRAARTLGAQVAAIVPLGGFTGERVRAGLDDVDVQVVQTGRETRMCVTVIDEASGAHTEFYERAVPLDDAEWSSLARRAGEVAGGWLAVSGSVPPERADDLVRVLVAAAGRGVRIAVDTHGAALERVLAQVRPDVVKVNRAEAEEYVRGASGDGALRHPDAAGLASLLAQRARLAVVTDGAAGAAAASGQDSWRAEPTSRGRFTVGSGDSFFAGLLVGLERDLPPSGALTLATAAGAANTLAPGAGVFEREDVHVS
jgi:1-phosphofructokinase family hexose kinase